MIIGRCGWWRWLLPGRRWRRWLRRRLWRFSIAAMIVCWCWRLRLRSRLWHSGESGRRQHSGNGALCGGRPGNLRRRCSRRFGWLWHKGRRRCSLRHAHHCTQLLLILKVALAQGIAGARTVAVDRNNIRWLRQFDRHVDVAIAHFAQARAGHHIRCEDGNDGDHGKCERHADDDKDNWPFHALMCVDRDPRCAWAICCSPMHNQPSLPHNCRQQHALDRCKAGDLRGDESSLRAVCRERRRLAYIHAHRRAVAHFGGSIIEQG